MITAIIPLRLSTDRLYDEVARIDRILATVPNDLFQVMIVDYGTPDARRGELDTLRATRPDLIIHRVEADGPFSIGHARDIGVQYARTPVVMFHDIDFLCSEPTYRRIAAEAAARNLSEQAYDFFTVPTVFLTRQATDDYLARFSGPDPDRWVHSQALHKNAEAVQHFALGSSALVINRYAYLCSGGHDRSFVGHGAEDFELYHRLGAQTPVFPRPPAYYDNIPNFLGSYRGFRAYFAMFGAEVWQRGILMVHLEHPRREATDKSYHRSRENFRLLHDRMREFDQNRFQPDPLPDPYVQDKTLVLIQPGTQPARAIRMMLPALGTYEMRREDDFATPDRLLRFLTENGFTQTVLLTPYGNDHRCALYQALHRAGARCLVFDRGALPDSWFLDDGGFLAESARYAPDAWDRPLDPDQTAQIEQWMTGYLDSTETLEANGKIKGVSYWRHKLAVGSKKVVFIALQRPSDTATRQFAGPVGSAAGFDDWIATLAARLDRADYAVLAKVHPLERDHPPIEGVTFVPADAHIHDLLELADKTVVINSGVGLLSLLHGTPTIACGDCFYAHPGLAQSATSPDELIAQVTAPGRLDHRTVQRFLHHLVNRFYSFGQSHYSETTWDEGEARRIVNRIHFRRVTVPDRYATDLGRPLPKLDHNSYLMLSSGRRPVTAAKPASAPKTDILGSWPARKHRLYRLFCLLTLPLQSANSRQKMRQNPLGFLTGAKHPVNRMAGRFFLDPSQRSY